MCIRDSSYNNRGIHTAVFFYFTTTTNKVHVPFYFINLIYYYSARSSGSLGRINNKKRSALSKVLLPKNKIGSVATAVTAKMSDKTDKCSGSCGLVNYVNFNINDSDHKKMETLEFETQNNEGASRLREALCQDMSELDSNVDPFLIFQASFYKEAVSTLTLKGGEIFKNNESISKLLEAEGNCSDKELKPISMFNHDINRTALKDAELIYLMALCIFGLFTLCSLRKYCFYFLVFHAEIFYFFFFHYKKCC